MMVNERGSGENEGMFVVIDSGATVDGRPYTPGADDSCTACPLNYTRCAQHLCCMFSRI